QESTPPSISSVNIAQNSAAQSFRSNDSGADGTLQAVMQQLNMLTQQVALMQGQAPLMQSSSLQPGQTAGNSSFKVSDDLTDEEKAELKKPFGATARIETKISDITAGQKKYLDNLISEYNHKTSNSKAYTQQNR